MENFITPIEWGGQVVITTAQLAEVYGTTTDNINKNFTQNKERFESGKHYVFLVGEELREFKSHPIFKEVVGKTTSQLYLWTRRGASRHCKILGTDKAWEQFDYLEDNYFDKNPKSLPLTTAQQIQLLAQGNVELNHKVDAISERIDRIELDLPILPVEADRITEAVRRKGVSVLGGKQSAAYSNRGLRQKVYNNLYANLKYNFGIKSYKAIKRSQCDKAVEIVNEWNPPVFLSDEINACNSQLRFDV